MKIFSQNPRALNTRLRRGLKHAAAPRPSGRTDGPRGPCVKARYLHADPRSKKEKKEFARLRRAAAPKARHRHANELSLKSYTDTCTYLRGALMVNFEALKKKTRGCAATWDAQNAPMGPEGPA